MSQPLDPRIANVVYNFLGTTLAQLNEIDKNNLGSSSLKAVKTDPKNVFRLNTDSSMNLMPSDSINLALPPVDSQSQATVVAAPSHNVVNAGINIVSEQSPVQIQPLKIKGAGEIKKQIDVIISALNVLKTYLNE
jgi:hypothetical protein